MLNIKNFSHFQSMREENMYMCKQITIMFTQYISQEYFYLLEHVGLGSVYDNRWNIYPIYNIYLKNFKCPCPNTLIKTTDGSASIYVLCNNEL